MLIGKKPTKVDTMRNSPVVCSWDIVGIPNGFVDSTLVLTRRVDEVLMIGYNITRIMLAVRSNQVSVSVYAPKNVAAFITANRSRGTSHGYV